MNKQPEVAYTFDDILLIPKYSEIQTRKKIDISSNLSDIKFSCPIISSPMDTVTENEMAQFMSDYGGLGIIHRYNSIEQQCQLIKKLTCKNKSAAIGITDDFFERTKQLVLSGANIICVDVAHGHHKNVKEAVKKLRRNYSNSIKIIVGNVATPEGALYLMHDENDKNYYIDGIRVGIGNGCFIPETQVCTISGYKSIENIEINDKVLTHDGTYKNVINKFEYEHDDTICVINNSIHCTKNHKFFVIRKEIINDNLQNITDSFIEKHAEWIEAEYIDKNKYFLLESS